MYKRRVNPFQQSNIKESQIAKAETENALEKIEKAYRKGNIDEHEKILLLIKSLFDTGNLSREYCSEAPVKSGTTAVETIQNYLQRRDARRDVVELAKRISSPPVSALNNSYKSPSGYFKIHYTLTGNNAVDVDGPGAKGVPSYIVQIGEAFDNTLDLTCNKRGFRKPILERGRAALDIYVYNLKGKYGFTFPNTYYNSKNNLRTASSFICIDNSYSSSKGFKKSREDCMKVTAAHEFFHAVQNAYNVDADSWWKEASATWNEDEVFDSVNDYIQYLSGIFSYPERPLEQSSYSGVVFAKFISENYGGYEMVRKIWDSQASVSRNSVHVIDKTFREKYKEEDIGTVYNKFTAFNYNPKQYYKEGNLWTIPIEPKGVYLEYPVKKQSRSLNHLSSNYELFRSNRNKTGSLTIKIEITDKKRLGFKIQKKRLSDDMCETIDLYPKAGEKSVSITCKDFGKVYKEICLIPSNLEKEYDGAGYFYEVSMT
jgi:hypothetical protein